MPYRRLSEFVPADLQTETLFEQAIEGCSHSSGLSAAAVLQRLEEGDRRMHSCFRYGIAKGLSIYLARIGSTFHEVYVYGSATKEGANPTSDIDVIVVVEQRRDEIKQLLQRLDLSITTHYRCLLGLDSIPVSLLDIQVIDRKEQAERSGYGAVLSGLYTRPICLWRSDPANLGAFRKEGPQRSLRPQSSTSVAT